MKRLTCPTYTAEIYIAGDIPVAKQLLREYCLQGFCVSIEPVYYVYTMGEESGMVVRIINYPRFPRTQDEIKQKGVELGGLLIKGLHAGSCSVVCTDETIFLSRRDKD